MLELTYDELMSKIELTKSILNNPSDDDLVELFPLYKKVLLLRETGFSEEDVKLTIDNVKPAPATPIVEAEHGNDTLGWEENHKLIREEIDNDPSGTRALVYAVDSLLTEVLQASTVREKDNLLKAIQQTIWGVYN